MGAILPKNLSRGQFNCLGRGQRRPRFMYII